MKEPSEHVEQRNLISWCNQQGPPASLIFAIPNGGQRSKITGAKLKLEGVRAGVPDLFLPVARHGYHGLFIEMKRIKSGGMSEAQKAWKSVLLEQGYYCTQCRGADAAIVVIRSYLEMA